MLEKEKERGKMYSEIFGEIALNLVIPLPWCPEAHSRRRNVEICAKARDGVRIRNAADIDEVVRAGVSAMRNGLDQELHQYLPIRYDDFVLRGERCEPLKLDLSGDERQGVVARIILSIMKAMYEAWAKDHLDELAAKSAMYGMDDQFKRMFVPFSLSEWRLVRRYYLSALALFGDNQPLPNEPVMIRKYDESAWLFCQQNGIVDAEILQRKIMEGSKFYPILSGRAEEFIRTEQSAGRVAKTIMKDIRRRHEAQNK